MSSADGARPTSPWRRSRRCWLVYWLILFWMDRRRIYLKVRRSAPSDRGPADAFSRSVDVRRCQACARGPPGRFPARPQVPSPRRGSKAGRTRTAPRAFGTAGARSGFESAGGGFEGPRSVARKTLRPARTRIAIAPPDDAIPAPGPATLRLPERLGPHFHGETGLAAVGPRRLRECGFGGSEPARLGGRTGDARRCSRASRCAGGKLRSPRRTPPSSANRSWIFLAIARRTIASSSGSTSGLIDEGGTGLTRTICSESSQFDPWKGSRPSGVRRRSRPGHRYRTLCPCSWPAPGSARATCRRACRRPGRSGSFAPRLRGGRGRNP